MTMLITVFVIACGNCFCTIKNTFWNSPSVDINVLIMAVYIVWCQVMLWWGTYDCLALVLFATLLTNGMSIISSENRIASAYISCAQLGQNYTLFLLPPLPLPLHEGTGWSFVPQNWRVNKFRTTNYKTIYMYKLHVLKSQSLLAFKQLPFCMSRFLH